MESKLLYTFPSPPDATEHRVLRLTVGTTTALGMARYRRLIRDASIWLNQKGIGVQEADEDSEVVELPPEESDLQDAVFRRAYMLASLQKVEEGRCAPDAETPTEWKECELPKEWQTIEGFIDGIDAKLITAWDIAALACNPETFFASMDEKKRKPGSVIVI